jgi:CheY-like chemotaxis protein
VPVRVLLVDDVDELRAIVRQSLRVRGGFDVVGEAADANSALDLATRCQPDVVVLDLGLPDLAGRELVPGLRRAAPDARIVVYTGTLTEARSGLAGSVEGFVRKDQDLDYLIDLLADVGRHPRRSASMRVGADVRQVSAVRRFVASQCERWDCGDMADDAVLIVSELVANAIVHGRVGCDVRASLTEDALRIEVTDTSGGEPDPQDADLSAERGRGLQMVGALALAWGVERFDDSGKVVWAEMARHP